MKRILLFLFVLTAGTIQAQKKEKVKGIAFPLSISLNNCTGNYIYEESMKDYNLIKEGDVVLLEWTKGAIVKIADAERVIVDEEFIVAVFE